MRHTNTKSGQTIVEAVIALASIMLTLAAISIAITTSMSNSEFSKNQSLAGRHAQEGMESIRFLRNTNPQFFNSFDNGTEIYCFSNSPVVEEGLHTGSCGGLVNLDNAFIREAEFTPGVSECGGGLSVKVNVYWSSGKCGSDNRFCHNTSLVSCFATNQSGDSIDL